MPATLEEVKSAVEKADANNVAELGLLRGQLAKMSMPRERDRREGVGVEGVDPGRGPDGGGGGGGSSGDGIQQLGRMGRGGRGGAGQRGFFGQIKDIFSPLADSISNLFDAGKSFGSALRKSKVMPRLSKGLSGLRGGMGKIFGKMGRGLGGRIGKLGGGIRSLLGGRPNLNVIDRKGRRRAAQGGMMSGIKRMMGMAGMGGRGIGGAGGMAARAAGMGAGAAGAAGVAAAGVGLVGAVVGVVAALAALPFAIKAFAQGIQEANFALKEFSPTMSMIAAHSKMRDDFRNMRKGERLAASAKDLDDAMHELKDNTMEMEIAWQHAKNFITTWIVKIGAAVAKPFNALAGKVNEIAGNTKPKMEIQTPAQWLQDVAGEAERAMKERTEEGSLKNPYFRPIDYGYTPIPGNARRA